jgi:hypothetical protein
VRRDEARSPALGLVAAAGRARTAAEGGEGIGPDLDGEEGERRPGPRGGVSTAREESSPFLPRSPAISSMYPTRCGASRHAGGRPGQRAREVRQRGRRAIGLGWSRRGGAGGWRLGLQRPGA